MAFDADRLKAALLNSRLQRNDPALYQVIYQLISAIAGTQKDVTTISGGSSSTNITNETTNIFQIVEGEGGSGESSDIIPGPQGIKGDTGATGSTGPSGLIGGIIAEDGIDGIDALPIVGPQGNPGSTGSQGPIGVSLFPNDGEDGESGAIIQLITKLTDEAGLIFCHVGYSNDSGDTITMQNDGQEYYLDVYKAGGGQWIEFPISLEAGTYSLILFYYKSQNASKIDIAVDGTTVVSGFDAYAVGFTPHQQNKWTGLSVLTTGLHTIRLTANGKNAASSDYHMGLFHLLFWRTA